jgi:hypothetical protein
VSLGVVLTAKNDGYGDNLPYRFLLAIQNFIARYDEVVYVDWVSLNGRTLLDEVRSKVSFRGNLKHIRITEKDLEKIDSTLLSLNFIEVLGRNIGIRRADSEFILSSNIDIIAARPEEAVLRDGVLYTAARRNVSQEVYFNKTDFIELGNTLLKEYLSIPTAPDSVSPDGRAIWDPGDDFSLVVCCGDFQLAHRNVWYAIKGFEESMLYRGYADSNLMKKGKICYKNEKINVPLFHLNHTSNAMSATRMNDQLKYGPCFNGTENKDTWGYSGYAFDIEIL